MSGPLPMQKLQMKLAN